MNIFCCISLRKQGKSEGFDSCDLPSHLKWDYNRRLFSLCDLGYSWMTSRKNRALLLYYVKLCASFQIHRWIQSGVTVRKHSIRVKTLQNNRAPPLYYLKLCVTFQSHGWIQSGVTVRKLSIRVNIGNRLVPCNLEIWWMTLNHFIAIDEFKPKLQPRNAQFGSNSTSFLAVWCWNLMDDLENQ